MRFVIVLINKHDDDDDDDDALVAGSQCWRDSDKSCQRGA